MAKTGCRCGVGLWNGYGPGGVNWDIYPRWQAEEVIKLHPEYGITDVSDYIAEKYNGGEWLAYSDWDLEEEKPLSEALIHPFRPHRYFVSPNKQKIYVYNTNLKEIEFVYQEEVKELENDLWRDDHSIYNA